MRILFSVWCNIILLKIYIYILGTIFQARSSSMMMKKIIMKSKFTLTMKWINKNRFFKYQSSASILSNSMCRSKSSSAFEFFWKEIDRLSPKSRNSGSVLYGSFQESLKGWYFLRPSHCIKLHIKHKHRFSIIEFFSWNCYFLNIFCLSYTALYGKRRLY